MKAVVIFISLVTHVVFMTMVITHAILSYSFHGVPVEDLVRANPILTIFGILVATAYAAITAVTSAFKLYEWMDDWLLP